MTKYNLFVEPMLWKEYKDILDDDTNLDEPIIERVAEIVAERTESDEARQLAEARLREVRQWE